MKYNFDIKWYEILESTNSEAYRQISDLDNLSVLAAGYQTAGRGQRGNKWLSKAWENLTFSLILKPSKKEITANNQFIISKIATLSVSDYLMSKKIACKIKWPNDIYVRDKKICGMLIENLLSGRNVSCSIIGIGLNINQTEFDPQLMNPTSIKNLTGKEYDVKQELPTLLSYFSRYWELYEYCGMEEIDQLYLNRLYRKDEMYRYRDCLTDKLFYGRIRGVTSNGCLQIEKEDGRNESFGFKEIGYIL